MAVSQVDDVGDGGEHGALAAGANGGVPLTDRQQQLWSRDDRIKLWTATIPKTRKQTAAPSVKITTLGRK